MTEKVSLVCAHTLIHTDTHSQLDICFTEDDVYTPMSPEVIRFFRRLSHVAHLAGLQCNTNWQHMLLYMQWDTERTGSERDSSNTHENITQV